MTIKEIAEALNVSTATVSNVIHGHLEKMSPDTAEMIRKKIEEYQYIPNMGARMLAKGASQIIGVVTNYPNRKEKFALQDPFVSEIIGALENAIRSRGYYMMLRAAQNAPEIHHIAQTWNADGLIVMGLQGNQCRELARVTRKPLVFIDCYFDSGEKYNNVGLADQEGMYKLTKYVLSLGHRSIAFIGDQPELWGVDCQRLKGHKQALEKAGISWDQDNYDYISKDSANREDDFRKLSKRIGRNTVFMFTSDYYAVEAVNYYTDHGFGIPSDISITGFDDNILSHIVRPRLTTVHQDVTQKADMAVKSIVDLLEGVSSRLVDVRLKPRVIRGCSIKNLKPEKHQIETPKK